MSLNTLERLTISDNFMFSAVMLDEDNCRRLLELILQIKIRKVIVDREKNFIYNSEYHGVRLDVYAQDENDTKFDIEMQTASKKHLSKRSRYYHSQIDMELLPPGNDYNKLPDTYVIFICDFDPIGLKKYMYTYRMRCDEDINNALNDGRHTIFLNTKGKNEGEVPTELVKFLQYVTADIDESKKDFDDDFIKSLQESVEKIKNDIRFRRQYMYLEEMLKDEFAEGKAEGYTEGKTEILIQSVIRILNAKGKVPESLASRIENEKDNSILDRWIDIALTSDNADEFIKSIS